MFGFSMYVKREDDFGITLRPLKKDEMPLFAEYMQHLSVVQYTAMGNAPTVEDENDWWERTRKSENSMHWGIVPDGLDRPVGVTGLNNISQVHGSCMSGIIIGDTAWWGKGVASMAHLARTHHADVKLNRATIHSHVRAQNTASLKALIKVGYRVTGHNDRDYFVGGKYIDTYNLSWVNPRFVSLLYPDGVPDYLTESLEKARIALELAKKVVTML